MFNIYIYMYIYVVDVYIYICICIYVYVYMHCLLWGLKYINGTFFGLFGASGVSKTTSTPPNRTSIPGRMVSTRC